MLWNGQFGATSLNEGTEALWTEGTPKEKNHLGFEGLEPLGYDLRYLDLFYKLGLRIVGMTRLSSELFMALK